MIMYVMLPTMELIIKGDQFLQICQAIHNQCSISAIMTATAFQKNKKRIVQQPSAVFLAGSLVDSLKCHT